MKDSAMQTSESACSADIPSVPPVSPVSAVSGPAISPVAENIAASTGPILNAKVKQLKTKITKRTKKQKDGSESVVWDVQVGSGLVRVYVTPHGKRELYTISYWVDGKRKREVLSSYDKAIAAAKKAGSELTKGDLGSAELSAVQRVACVRAMQTVAPTGVPIEVVAGVFAQAHEKLLKYKGRVSLLTAIDYYVKQHPVEFEPMPVEKVVKEFLQAKGADRLSDRYLQSLKWSLGRFAEAFAGDITTVMGTDIDTWLRGLGRSPRTRNNLRSAVQTLFSFAKARRYLPKDHDEIESVGVVKDADGEIEIFTPAELAEILGHAGDRLVPFFALGAFAGIRHAEIQRLDWKDVRFDDGLIEIRPKKAKTASRRIVPIVDCLRAWLAGHRQPAGSVCAYRNMAYEIDELVGRINKARRAAWAKSKRVNKKALKEAERQARAQMAEAREKHKRIPRGELPPAGAETAEIEGWTAFAWKHNALRHSFISYRVAETQDVAKVSLEAGNSPQMIFKHYRELVRPADAKTWFSIVPGGEGKVIEMRKAA